MNKLPKQTIRVKSMSLKDDQKQHLNFFGEERETILVCFLSSSGDKEGKLVEKD